MFLYFYVESATCATVSCKSGQKCLVEKKTGRPRCVTCNLLCSEAETSGKRKDTSGKVCGSNDKTYHSWCQMFMDACATGVVIETKASGPCRGDIPSGKFSINIFLTFSSHRITITYTYLSNISLDSYS